MWMAVTAKRQSTIQNLGYMSCQCDKMVTMLGNSTGTLALTKPGVDTTISIHH